MARIVLGIEYDGSGFSGWQWQAGKRTVQDELQKALSKIAQQPITVLCAGRTDAGVHALEQVVHFDCDAPRPPRAWLMGGNTHLPGDVRITWVKTAAADFHARYSAIARYYRYVILNRPTQSALLRNQTTWCYQPLAADSMHRAAQHLLGEHDFSSFRAHSCQSVSPNRLMYFIDVQRQGEQIIIDLCANAFLHHMVRNIVGVLMEIGSGKQAEHWTRDLLDAKDRTQAAMTAPADGLYLAGVFYPAETGIAQQAIFNRLPKDTRRFDHHSQSTLI